MLVPRSNKGSLQRFDSGVGGVRSTVWWRLTVASLFKRCVRACVCTQTGPANILRFDTYSTFQHHHSTCICTHFLSTGTSFGKLSERIWSHLVGVLMSLWHDGWAVCGGATVATHTKARLWWRCRLQMFLWRMSLSPSANNDCLISPLKKFWWVTVWWTDMINALYPQKHVQNRKNTSLRLFILFFLPPVVTPWD